MNSIRRQRGFSLIEGLVAALIIGVCIFGLMSLWGYSANMTVNSDERAVGYQLVRRGLERVKAQGFWGAPATQTYYYDRTGVTEAFTRDGMYFNLTITITNSSSEVQNGVVRPSDFAIRTVVAVVSKARGGAEVGRGGTLLVRGGL